MGNLAKGSPLIKKINFFFVSYLTRAEVQRVIIRENQEIELTYTEFEIFKLLAKHPGIVFSKEQIYDIVCKESYSGDYNIVMSHKQMIHSIFDYKQDRGEIPQYHMNFNWSGKQLQC